MPDVAMALWMGRSLCLIGMNERYAQNDPCAVIGAPASELYPDAHNRPIQEAMRRVIDGGDEEWLPMPGADLWLIPYDAPDGRRGVVTYYAPRRPVPQTLARVRDRVVSSLLGLAAVLVSVPA